MFRSIMVTFYSHVQIQRGGKEYRVNPERFFYIKRVGWFVRTRGEIEIYEGLELADGIVGPFSSRSRAKFHLLKIIYEDQPALFDDRPPNF